MPRIIPLAALLLTLAWPARAEEAAACKDAEKCKHWKSAKAGLPAVAAYADRDLTKDMIGEDTDCSDISSAFLDAAPAACKERVELWTALEGILAVGDDAAKKKMKAAIDDAAGKGNRFAPAYFLARVAKFRKDLALKPCTEELRKKKHPLCEKRADLFLEGLSGAVTPPANWQQGKAVSDPKKVEPCLRYDYGLGEGTKPIEAVPSVWGDTFVIQDAAKADGGKALCVSLAEAAKSGVAIDGKKAGALLVGETSSIGNFGGAGGAAKPPAADGRQFGGAGLSDYNGGPVKFTPPKPKTKKPEPPPPGISTEY